MVDAQIREEIQEVISDFLFDKFESDNEKLALDLTDLLENLLNELNLNGYNEGYNQCLKEIKDKI